MSFKWKEKGLAQTRVVEMNAGTLASARATYDGGGSHRGKATHTLKNVPLESSET